MKYVNEEPEVRNGRENPMIPVTPEATYNLPVMEDMLKPWYEKQLYLLCEKQAGEYRDKIKWAHRRISTRNTVFIAFLFVLMIGGAAMNDMGIVTSSNKNRERRIAETTAAGKAKIETEFSEMIKAEEDRSRRQDEDLKALEEQRADAYKYANSQGRTVSNTWLNKYYARKDSIEAKKAMAENRMRDHIGERNKMVAALETDAREKDSTGLEFYGLLCVGFILPFAVGMAMYCSVASANPGVMEGLNVGRLAAAKDGWAKVYVMAGMVGQLLEAYFTSCFIYYEIDELTFPVFGYGFNPAAAITFIVILVVYPIVYHACLKKVMLSWNERNVITFFHRQDFKKDLEDRAKQVEAFVAIGDKLQDIENRQLAARFDFKGEAMRLKAQAEHESAAAQNMAESQAAVAELHALIPRADSAADFGRRLYEMEVAGKLEYLTSRAGTLKAVCEMAGWGEQYGTVTKTMQICREKAARAAQEVVPPPESGEKIGE